MIVVAHFYLFRFFYGTFKEKYYWYGIVIIFMRVILAFAVVSNEEIMVTIGSSTLLFGLTFQFIFNPYKEKWENYSDFCSFALILTTRAILSTTVPVDGSVWYNWFIIILLRLITFAFAFVLLVKVIKIFIDDLKPGIILFKKFIKFKCNKTQ